MCKRSHLSHFRAVTILNPREHIFPKLRAKMSTVLWTTGPQGCFIEMRFFLIFFISSFRELSGCIFSEVNFVLCHLTSWAMLKVDHVHWRPQLPLESECSPFSVCSVINKTAYDLFQITHCSGTSANLTNTREQQERDFSFDGAPLLNSSMSTIYFSILWYML